MIALLLLLLLTSCVKTEIVNETLPINDTTYVKPRKELTQPTDTTEERVPITFNPSVEDWEEKDIEM